MKVQFSDHKEQMLKDAQEARHNAYAPYSKFKVGAAILGADGKIYTGCNVENISYGLTICAERNAIFHMVSRGCTKMVGCVVATETGSSPCGGCRQVMSEFVDKDDATVIMVNTSNNTHRDSSIHQLLPLRVEICRDTD
jgi:cytidine deaminase